MKKATRSKTTNISLKHKRYSFIEGYKDNPQYKYLKQHKEALKLDSYMRIKVDDEIIPIYVCNHAYLFSFTPLKLLNLDTGKVELVNVNKDLWPVYLKGFRNGQSHFKENFKVSGEIIYGSNFKVYERQLHKHYHHTDYNNNFNEGWSYYIKWVSSVISLDNLDRWGFFAGIIYELNNVRKLHPLVFSNFEKCNSVYEKKFEEKISESQKINEIDQNILKITITPSVIMEIIPQIEHLFEQKEYLSETLAGKTSKTKLKFNGGQNQLTELFRRMCYNNHISENKRHVAKWMSENFKYYDPKGKTHVDFNEVTVYEILTKGKGEARKSKRICNIDSLPYKSNSQLSRMK